MELLDILTFNIGEVEFMTIVVDVDVVVVVVVMDTLKLTYLATMDVLLLGRGKVLRDFDILTETFCTEIDRE
jgi:hypothetical protein